MTADIQAVLRENLDGMRKSVLWLKRSYSKCIRIGVKERYTEDEFDDFENLASRFARMLDIILNKVFRSIDAAELEDGGTLLDVVNRAEKRGIVDSAERVRDLKDLRNDIVHEYETDDLQSVFRQTLDSTPELFTIAEKIERYCERFTGASTSTT
jgi:uncharacterized protein YutE (UPF0331/DUF86 family)